MPDIRSICLDPAKVETGTWVTFRGIKFLITYKGEKWQRRYAELMDERRALLRDEQDSDEAAAGIVSAYQEILILCTAETLLLGWDDLTDDGEPVPYSVERAAQLLRDSLPLREFVWERANNLAAYSLLTDARGKKTLEPSSTGISSSESRSDGLLSST